MARMNRTDYYSPAEQRALTIIVISRTSTLPRLSRSSPATRRKPLHEMIGADRRTTVKAISQAGRQPSRPSGRLSRAALACHAAAAQRRTVEPKPPFSLSRGRRATARQRRLQTGDDAHLWARLAASPIGPQRLSGAKRSEGQSESRLKSSNVWSASRIWKTDDNASVDER